MPTSRSKQVRRWVADERADSHVRWLRAVYSLSLNTERPPSDSAILRRGLARLAEHMNDLLLAGRLDGLQGPHPQDVEAERNLLAQYAEITSAAPPAAVVDNAGKFLTWQEAIARGVQQRDAKSLTIPTAEGESVA